MIKLSILIDKLIWLFVLVLFSSFYIFYSNVYSRFILLSITIVILFLLIIRYGLKLRLYWNSFHTCVLLFALFCLLSYFWSIDPISSLVQASIIFQLLICMSVLYIYFIQKKTIMPMLDIIMWAGYIITIYSFIFYGIDNIKYMIEVSKRLDNSYSNINDIGVLVAFSSIITIYKMLFCKFKIYNLFIIFNIILIAATGSRKALIFLILGAIIIFFYKYSSKNIFINLFRYVLILAISFFTFKLISDLQMFSILNDRMEGLVNFFTGEGNADGSTLTRFRMLNIGWEQFLQNPLLGIGIASSGELLASTIGWRTYLHNNYVELLSGGGLIGTILYYLMFILPAIQLFQQRNIEERNIILCLIIIFLLLIMDFGAVSYGSKKTYFYIMLLFIQVEINKRNFKNKY